jgi:hypothetical protein
VEEETKPIWRRLESAAVTALALTLLGLFVGQSAQQYAAQNAAPAVETAKMQPRFNAIDYATTASIKSGTVIIGPCDTHKP